MWQRGVTYVDHYLDDIGTMGPPGVAVCGKNLDIIRATCTDLGVPLAMDKPEGPRHCITFLGIEIDTQAGMLRLPADKLSRLQEVLRHWTPRKACQRHQLESLIGSLQHACRVIKPGRAFLRRMIDLLRILGATRGHHHIRLNQEFQADLQWWRAFAGHWNGVATLQPPLHPSFQVQATGAVERGHKSWFQFQWPAVAQQSHISFKELFAVLLAVAAWGNRWWGTCVQWFCDNQAAVHAVSSRSCRDAQMMCLVRCRFFFEALFDFQLIAAYLPGVQNDLADDLSCDRLSSQRSNPRIRRQHDCTQSSLRCCWSSGAGPHQPGQRCSLLL